MTIDAAQSPDALAKRLLELNGQALEGNRCVIVYMGRYLCGMPYTWSIFAERAYEFGFVQAVSLLHDFPILLQGAQIEERE